MKYAGEKSKVLSRRICTILAETITGGIRKEYKSKETQRAEIPYNEPKYSTAAILAYNKANEY